MTGVASEEPEGIARVVIIGAGFAGLQAARELAGEPFTVLVIDRNNYHGFWPLLYQVSAGQVEDGQVGYPIRSILRKAGNVDFLMMDVERIDRHRKVVVGRDREVPYDYLILAAGSRTSYLGVEGAERHTLPFKSLEHGVTIRDHILGAFERAVTTEDAAERRALLTFAMVGGGPTGVELAGALAELVRKPFPRDYPALDMSEVRILLVEALERPLPTFSKKASRYTEKRLEDLGVELRLDAKVEAVEPGCLRLADGEAIPAGTIIWTAGVEGSPVAAASGLDTTKKGTVPVDFYLRSEEDPTLFVAGDLAHFEADDHPLPMLAQVAIQQARQVAENVKRSVRGVELRPFSYTDPGVMAVIGRGRAVVERGSVCLTGALAWPLWALVHIGKLVGFRNRLLVLVNWAASYIFSKPGVRFILHGNSRDH